MTRTVKALSVLLCVALLCGGGGGGCSGNKNKDGTTRTSRKRDKSDQNTDTAQRDSHQKPDAFESANDPPLTADTHFAAGQLTESQGDPNRAIVQYQQALKLDPNHKGALFNLGRIYTQTKRYNDAIGMWQRYLKVTDNSPAAYNNLALCYDQAGKLEEAEKTYKAAIEKDPSDPTCRVNYGLMLARHGRIDDATAQLQTVLSPAETQYNIGSVFELQGNKEEAKKRYQKALELDPKLVDARSRLAALK